MTKRRELLGMTVLAGAGLLVLWPRHRAAKAAQSAVFPVMHTDADWRSLLSPAAYDVLRREGGDPVLQQARLRDAGRHLCLRRMRPAGLFIGHELRQPHRLAELLAAAGACGRGEG